MEFVTIWDGRRKLAREGGRGGGGVYLESYNARGGSQQKGRSGRSSFGILNARGGGARVCLRMADLAVPDQFSVGACPWLHGCMVCMPNKKNPEK